MKILGIILAAGEGKRLKVKNKNKTTVKFAGKPMINFGVETMTKVCDKTIVVVGAYAETVKKALKDFKVSYVTQKDRKGTGNAALVAINSLKADEKFDYVLLGYGDHMMFYTPEILRNLLSYHKIKAKDLTLLTTDHSDPNKLCWGRIVRDKNNEVIKIVEHKDASDEEKEITEVNPGFYCFNFRFLNKFLPEIEPSSITKEYYLTDMVKLSFNNGDGVAGLKISFENVGIGVNNPEQLSESEILFQKTH